MRDGRCNPTRSTLPLNGVVGRMVTVEPVGVSESACGECVLGQEKGLERRHASPSLGTEVGNNRGVKGEARGKEQDKAKVPPWNRKGSGSAASPGGRGSVRGFQNLGRMQGPRRSLEIPLFNL